MTEMKRQVEWKMDGGLVEGVAIAVSADGMQSKQIRIPEEKAPEWAASITLSPEDYGKMLRHAMRSA